MHILKKIFTATTGYWVHKISTLPIGADLYIDIHKRIKFGPLNTMFDVGANVGQTWEGFRHNEPNAKIYCFEPVLEIFKELKNKAGKDKNCVFENIAFGDVPGEKTIKLFGIEHSALNSLKDGLMNYDTNAREEIIKIDTLDNYCSKNRIDKIDFLKIDTEGYELNVLEGAKEMLSTASVSFIYCEIGFLKHNNRNTYFAELTEWLANKNYHFFGLYQMVSNGWKDGDYFGNALYVHKDIFKP
jgi:FkbM family methyltransferase